MAEVKTPTKSTTVRLKQLYFEQYRQELLKELGLKNIYEVPQLEKIVLNVGLGKAKDDKRAFEAASTTLRKITAQQPIETIAKQSIAAFKLREGNKIGLKVTLRGERMYEFLDRLINLVMPRLRDFHGVSNRAFDKSGNYSLGIPDQSVFPELTFEETTMSHGLQVVFVINSQSPAHAKALLTKFGMPFEKSQTDKETN
ncbi:MAG TPA: 50S ribosomal protein L5 [Candidatus Saccharimonadales bacterium]|nr:50S ribosomal protein L5 [Candidatus Saccharimonadales bacterium]